MIKLSERWAERLLSQPETGMGYQVVSIRLKDGRSVDDVTVIGGVISELPSGVGYGFTDDDIEEIIVTHGRKGAR